MISAANTQHSTCTPHTEAHTDVLSTYVTQTYIRVQSTIYYVHGSYLIEVANVVLSQRESGERERETLGKAAM